MPIRAGKAGRGRLRSASNSPSACSRALSSSNARRNAPSPASSIWSRTIWYSPRASYRVSRPRASTFMPSRGTNCSQLLLGLNIAQRTCARASFRVKYRCPDDGRATLPSSASIQTSGNAPSSRSRASVLSWLGVRTCSGAVAVMARVLGGRPRYRSRVGRSSVAAAIRSTWWPAIVMANSSTPLKKARIRSGPFQGGMQPVNASTELPGSYQITTC